MSNIARLYPNGAENEPSATQRAYSSLRRMIILCDIAPGEKLKIDELRQKLDIGTSAIREALSLLVSDQLVLRLDQRGFKSADVNKTNFQEILELRSMLEERALSLSIKNTHPEWEEQIVLAGYRLQQAEKAGLETMEDQHKEFHMALIGNCGAPLLLRYCEQLYDLNIRYRYVAAAKDAYSRRDVRTEHQEILEAVLDRDVETASKRLLEHYALTGDYLSKLIFD